MGPIRVLVVDADRNARSALAALLGDEGYDVATAADEAGARARAQLAPPDIVLCDPELRTRAGRPLYEALAPPGSPRALILMSRRRGARVPETARLLEKPLDVEALFAAVASAAHQLERPGDYSPRSARASGVYWPSRS